MARPTTWRRSWNFSAFGQSSGSLDLLLVQPNETLGGTWWQYSLRSVGNTLQQSAPPLQNAVPVVGLILVDDESGPVLPLADADAPWLWWEMADFNHAILNNLDAAYTNWSVTGGTQRKVQAMRRNPGSNNQVLRVAWQTDEGSATPAEVSFNVTVAASALIILP